MWVRTPEAYRWLADYLTRRAPARAHVRRRATLEVDRFEFPNLLALNFVVKGLLGDGVAASLRSDPQAKSLGRVPAGEGRGYSNRVAVAAPRCCSSRAAAGVIGEPTRKFLPGRSRRSAPARAVPRGVSAGTDSAPSRAGRSVACGGVARTAFAIWWLGGASLAWAATPVFGPAAPVNGYAATDTANDSTPRIATDGHGTWLSVWASTYDLGGTIGDDSDILVARSTDLGVSWSAPVPVNRTATTDDEFDFAPAIATDGHGLWIAVWVATNGADTDIFIARSTNAGATWTNAVPLYADAATDTGNDDHPQIVSDGAGTWIVVWDSNGRFGNDRDVLYARSTDGGVTWSAPAALGSNASTDRGSDQRPQLATDGARHVDRGVGLERHARRHDRQRLRRPAARARRTAASRGSAARAAQQQRGQRQRARRPAAARDRRSGDVGGGVGLRRVVRRHASGPISTC